MPEISPELENALADYWANMRADAVPIKSAVVTEYMDADGELWMDVGWSKGSKAWHLKGLLHEALDVQVTTTTVNEVADLFSDDD